MAVPLFNTSAPLAPIDAEIRAKVNEIIDSKRFIFGPEVEAFEREFAAYIGTEHAIGVANGTDALLLALRALGVGPGDEVVVPSFTFFASAEPIVLLGATPVWCDIDPATFVSTADHVREVLTPRTKAVIAVHLFGNVAPIAEIEALGVPVVEDAAQAAGSQGPDGRPGALGTVATFSFYPSKNLGAFGDGGAVATRDETLADAVRILRFHGSADKVTYTEVGYNSRLDELQAAILRVMLPHLDGWAAHRAMAGDWYAEAGLGDLVVLPTAAPGARPAWHVYVARHERGDDAIAALAAAGIGTRAYYRTPIHRQPAMAPFDPPADGALPGTDEAARTHFALPMSAAITRRQVDEVVGVLRDARLG
jgi:dTDP-3-amino-3,4,6-trideoxy-alpha-D-glucose transaminase